MSRVSGYEAAGVYGRVPASNLRCKRGNNPYSHNPECDCREQPVRAAQTVPYDTDDPFVQAYLERLTDSEIGARLGMSQGQVRRRRARLGLRVWTPRERREHSER